jgi:hypothetical protein
MNVLTNFELVHGKVITVKGDLQLLGAGYQVNTKTKAKVSLW